MDIVSKFTHHLRDVLTRALCFVVDENGESVEPMHLLWSLHAQNGSVASEILEKGGVKKNELESAIRDSMTERTGEKKAIPALSDASKSIIEKAVLTANMFEHTHVGTEHLLAGLMQAKNKDVQTYLSAQKIKADLIADNLKTIFKTTSSFPELDKVAAETTAVAHEPLHLHDLDLAEIDQPGDEAMTALEFFTVELTTKEATKQITPVIGREWEIDRMTNILARRTKNNPILVGEPGVGKTAIVEGLAKRIVEGTASPAVANKHIHRLDLAALIAGTMYRGEFESRLRQLVDEVQEDPDIILFIDEVHTIMGAGAATGSLDVANIMKPALARGSIRCIGATTPAEFKKSIETDGALERRFQPIVIEEPTLEQTRTILLGVQSAYETFHGVRFETEAIESALRLSKKYFPTKHFPDKAIDLLDEAGAYAAMRRPADKRETSIKALEKELRAVQEQKREAVVGESFSKAIELKAKEIDLRTQMAELKKKRKKQQIVMVSAADILSAVSRMTGTADQQQGVTASREADDVRAHLSKRIFGQDETIERVVNAVSRAKLGLGAENRPLASFLFAGPSGVGKTALAKAMAEVFYSGTQSLLRLDMSEYKEPHSASKLLGSPAGYVGYRDSSILTDHMKQHPHSVVIFDEIEKAHPDIQGLLLQMLEEGQLRDATGRLITFQHATVVMTTNIGRERFERGSMGFGNKELDEDLERDVRRLLEEVLKPELINRLDHVCIFRPLETKTLEEVARRELNLLHNRLRERGVSLIIEPAVFSYIAKQSDERQGARDIRHLIEREIEPLISQHLLSKQGAQDLILSLKNNVFSIIEKHPQIV